jgi:hypothetical protein
MPNPSFGQNWQSNINHIFLLDTFPLIILSIHSWPCVYILVSPEELLSDGHVIEPRVFTALWAIILQPVLFAVYFIGEEFIFSNLLEHSFPVYDLVGGVEISFYEKDGVQLCDKCASKDLFKHN